MTDFTELKVKQRAMWALGEYDRIADGLTISTDQTLRVARIRSGENVLDLATGTGVTRQTVDRCSTVRQHVR